MAGVAIVSLRLYPASPRAGALGRAADVIEELASRCRVSTTDGQWRVVYEAADVSEAMAMCAADLDGIDPGWMEFLDFEALRSS